MKNLGILLKKLRTDANLTQEDFASKLNTSKSTVSKWENGSSTPDTETILRLSHLFNISCDDLLHPTKTLEKMISATNTSTSSSYAESSDEKLPDENSSHVIEPGSHPTSRYFTFTPKKILLLCLPILVLGIAIGVIGSRIFTSDHTFSAVAKFDEAYALVDARNDVKTSYGSAYELVYYLYSDSSREDLILYADDVAADWRSGSYTSSSEPLLIISFYKPNDDITDEYKAYFRAFYLKPQS